MTTATYSRLYPQFKGSQANENASECIVDTSQGEVYLAGQIVEPGNYRQIDVGRIVPLLEQGALPGSLDGRVACYERLPKTWGEMILQSGDRKH